LIEKDLEHITGSNGYCWVVPISPLLVGLGGDPAHQGNNHWQLALKNSDKVVLPTCNVRFIPFPTNEELKQGLVSSPPFFFYPFEKVPPEPTWEDNLLSLRFRQGAWRGGIARYLRPGQTRMQHRPAGNPAPGVNTRSFHISTNGRKRGWRNLN